MIRNLGKTLRYITYDIEDSVREALFELTFLT
jgi:hypothetical protein